MEYLSIITRLDEDNNDGLRSLDDCKLPIEVTVRIRDNDGVWTTLLLKVVHRALDKTILHSAGFGLGES